MKFLYILILLFISKNILALELSCIFEEVHLNGDTEQGLFLVKDEKFRYQYFSKNLFTVFHKGNSFFYVENRDKNKFFRINENTQILSALKDIISEFTQIKNEYSFGDTYVKVELSKSKFIKRVIVLSEQLKLSVYLNDCKEVPIKDIYFFWSPFWDYNY